MDINGVMHNVVDQHGKRGPQSCFHLVCDLGSVTSKNFNIVLPNKWCRLIGIKAQISEVYTFILSVFYFKGV